MRFRNAPWLVRRREGWIGTDPFWERPGDGTFGSRRANRRIGRSVPVASCGMLDIFARCRAHRHAAAVAVNLWREFQDTHESTCRSSEGNIVVDCIEISAAPQRGFILLQPNQ